MRLRGDFKEPPTIMRKILDKLVKMFSCNILVDEIINEKIFSDVPYEKPGSFSFIQACQQGRLGAVEKLLEKNKWLVFDFDYA